MVMTRPDEGRRAHGPAGPAAGPRDRPGPGHPRRSGRAWAACSWRWPASGRSCRGSRRRARPTSPTRWPVADLAPGEPVTRRRGPLRADGPARRGGGGRVRLAGRARGPGARWRPVGDGQLLQLGAVSDQVGGEPAAEVSITLGARPGRRRSAAPRRHRRRVRHRGRDHGGRHRPAGRGRHRGRRIVRRRQRAHGHPGAARAGRRRRHRSSAGRSRSSATTPGQVTLVRTTGRRPARPRRRPSDPAEGG